MKKISTFLFLLSCLFTAHAQTLTADSTGSPEQRAAHYFNSFIKLQSRLYNGPVYRSYGANVEGSANFQDLDFTLGEVVYDGEKFSDIPLLYDLYQDRVVARVGKENRIALISNKVASFSINGHHFRYVDIADTSKNILKPGFFDFIYDGQEKILAKRTKIMDFVSGKAGTDYYFSPKISYYLKQGESYYAFSTANDFLNLHKDKKNELKQFMKAQKIKFKKQPEEAMVRLAQHYEKIRQ
ncbi:hypothetical protein D9M68_620450 [compost metagenome]